jgi:hypothetical protein
MGFITTVVIYNDAMHQIPDDPTFGKRLHNAILKLYEGKPQDIGHYGQAVEGHHNSGIIPVLVGKGTGVPMGISISEVHDDVEMELLKRLADNKGYLLRKRPTKKKKA